MPVSCVTRSERLHQYVDGELPEAERQEVEAHLAGCAPCREARAGLERLVALLRRELADPDARAATAGLWGAIEARLGPEAAPAGAGRAVPAAPARAGAALTRARRLRIPRFVPARTRGWLPRRARSLLAAAAALAVAALLAPLAYRSSVQPADEAATVAAVETGGEAQVILLAGSDSQPPIILITEAAPRAGSPF
jgi:anti-sigma factor RsiW